MGPTTFRALHEGVVSRVAALDGLHPATNVVVLGRTPNGQADGAFSVELATENTANNRDKHGGTLSAGHQIAITVARRTKPKDPDETYRLLLDDEVAILAQLHDDTGAFDVRMLRYLTSERAFNDSGEWVTSRMLFSFQHLVQL